MTTSQAGLYDLGPPLSIGAEVTVHLKGGAMAVGTVTRIVDGDLYLTGTLLVDGSAGQPDSHLWLPVTAILAVVIAP